MKNISKIFLQGLFAILPIVLTIAIIVWLVTTLENYLSQLLLLFMPEDMYWPGLGLILGIVLIFALGLFIKLYLGRLIIRGLNKLMERIPVVRAVHNALNDMVRFVTASEKEELQKTVLVEVQEGAEVIGFVTSQNLELGERSDLIAVYIPMSYQIGGFTLFMPKDKVKELDIPPSKAMKKVLTAAMGSEKRPLEE
ncbi:DUF502 domain-containing protein [Kangiella sediminilitoris]|uniref:DUF502 domain-containing protein n=1 Tax=Kangiella sediminilitoris TaxID=1144748 RepID=A0A1B3B9X4_9GAMM|nr:DUF502 domain-containing protein [Kangiella sediminilitoris]AOE49612.1 hypothetical protein KS2013_890 [Kangiella sediminilitoris]